MNLSDLITRVYACTDRNPNTAAYKNQVINWLNDAYLMLCSQHKWTFMQARTTMTVYPDYTTGTVSVTLGSRAVTGSGTSWDLTMDGHYFIGPDGATYTIGAVESATSLFLTSAYAGASAVDQTYTIRYFAYAMPDDCIEPTTVVSRNDDQGRIRYIDNETEATYYLDRDDTGDPQVYMAAGTWNPRTLDYDPTLAAGAAGGSLTSGITYYYRIVLNYEGIQGPPSNEVSFTATATGKISFTAIQDFTSIPGMTKYIYRRVGTSRMYYYLASRTYSQTTYIDDGSVSEDLDRPLKEFGQTLKVWFWPRPDTEKDVELWYFRRPRRMQKENDVPDLPQEGQEIIWKMAAIEVLKKYNQPTSTIQAEVDELLSNLRRRYTTRSDREWRLGNSWEGGMGRRYVNLGTATLT